MSGKALVPAYGMAEATLCITLGVVGAEVRTVVVDRAAYEIHKKVNQVPSTETPDGIEVVSCGRPLLGHEIGIADDEGTLQPEGRVGEILFKGPSVTKGYFGNLEATRSLYKGEWMKTGDMGFIIDGELFVSGRKNDLIIIAGRNYYPQSIEWCVEKVSGIRSGNVVALSIPGKDTERLVIVAECKDDAFLDELREKVKTQVLMEIGLEPFDVVLVQRWSLPKTSSGKVRRSKTRAMYEAGLLEGARTVL